MCNVPRLGLRAALLGLLLSNAAWSATGDGPSRPPQALAAPGFAAASAALSRSEIVQRGYGKFDRTLIEIAEATRKASAGQAARAVQAAVPQARLALSVPSAVPSVLVEINVTGDAATVERSLRGLGVERSAHFRNRISAWLPSDRLVAAGAIAEVRRMHASMMRAQAGSVMTQGDFFQRSEALRASTLRAGLVGNGVTVGVMSDSYGCTSSVRSADQDVASGDLPPDVTVLSELSGCLGASDEGRAMMQIVHDIAPGAKLKFYSAFNGEADFANGILALAAAGAQVIVDDVLYFDEPFFQDGIIAQAVDTVAAQGVSYFSAAGNQARQSYEGAFVDSGLTGPVGSEIAGMRLMRFDVGGVVPSPILPFTFAAGSSQTFILQWDEPFASAGGSGARNALNLCYTDLQSGPLLAANILNCTGPNTIGDDPFLMFTANFSPPNATLGGIVIALASGTPPGRVKLLFPDIVPDRYATSSGASFGHSRARGAVSVGASYFRANPLCQPQQYTNYTLESFSSSGGTPILFDAKGARLATAEQRQKPNIVAPDGGSTTFFYSPLGARSGSLPACVNTDASYNFFGTSAAAPHAAGIAALLLEAQPAASPSMIRDALQKTAIDMGTPGVDDDTGYGFVQADAALAALMPALQVSASSLSLGDARVGSASPAVTIQLSNTGGSPLQLPAISPPSGFAIAGGSCWPAGIASQLAPSTSCTFTVSATPSAEGAQSATLVIASDAPSGPAQVQLSARGVAAKLSLDRSSLAFGQLQIQGSGATQTVTLSNTGTAVLNLLNLAVSGEGYELQHDCGSAIAVGGQCTATVRFTPTRTGETDGTLSIASDAVNAATASVALSGSGLASSTPPPSPSPSPAPAAGGGGSGGGAFGLWLLLPGFAAAWRQRRRRAASARPGA